MEDLKSWSVTYTKHLKQKRKVYQDGVLQLHASILKVMLYDDCEKLLDSRFLKKDEVIKSGEALTFDSYLVDVGDPEGDHKPLSDLNFQGKDKIITEKTEFLPAQKFRKKSFFVENRQASAQQNKTSLSNPNASQKIIREFKKSELHKYGASQSSPDATKSSTTEWQVLYTTQTTQKAKKYQDGILRLAICGSQGRQVMLYDMSRKLLDSRFLKRDEMIKTGETLAFEAHLVDIGEPDENHKPPLDLNIDGRNSNLVGQTRMLHEKQNHLEDDKAVIRKWHAMYTTQITQKAKKYHCGFLTLASCGSYQMQITLLDEGGTTLSRKYQKLTEDVKSGNSLQLPKYLVEVGEPWMNSEGESQKSACLLNNVSSNLSSLSVDKIKLSTRIPTNKLLHGGESQNSDCLQNNIDSKFTCSSVDNTKLSRFISPKKPIRDVHSILSILKRPTAQKSVVPIKKESANQEVLDETTTCRSEISDTIDTGPEFVKFEDSDNREKKFRFIGFLSWVRRILQFKTQI